jgi:hypothetical protein
MLNRSTRKQPFELKLGYLMPAFALFGLVVNLQITKPRDLASASLVQVPVRASHSANYGVDPLDLNFAPLNPAVIDEVRKDNKHNNSSGDAAIVLPSPSAGPSATTTYGPTATPGGSPLGISLTLPPGLSTLPSQLLTNAPEFVPTLINSLPGGPNILDELPAVLPDLPDIIDSLPGPNPPICVPLPFRPCP